MPTRLFYFFAQEDEDLCTELGKRLYLLQKQGLIATWHPGMAAAGEFTAKLISQHLNEAEMILIPITPDLLHGYDALLQEVFTLHEKGSVKVVPLHLRPTYYEGTQLAKFKALPSNGIPLTSWDNLDAAWREIILSIRKLIPEPEPIYQDEHSRFLGEQLRTLYAKRKELKTNQSGLGGITQEILGIRRKMRQGPQLEPGDFLSDGRYRLLDRIGHGGFATVWKAWDEQTINFVAIKVLHGQWVKDQSRIERFNRGARQMAKLHHSHIVPIIEEQGEDAGFYYFVMEYLSGGDLRQSVLSGRISLERGLKIIGQIGDALQYAHDHGIIHRDVKPANILLDYDGNAQLADFDLAMVEDSTGGTRTGALGTFIYSAPEALENAKFVDTRADIYSLAMTTLFVLYGKELPRSAIKDSLAFMFKHVCFYGLINSLNQALDWDPSSRQNSIRELIGAMGAELRTTPDLRQVQTERRQISAIYIFLLTMPIFIGIFSWFNNHNSRRSKTLQSNLTETMSIAEIVSDQGNTILDLGTARKLVENADADVVLHQDKRERLSRQKYTCQVLNDHEYRTQQRQSINRCSNELQIYVNSLRPNHIPTEFMVKLKRIGALHILEAPSEIYSSNLTACLRVSLLSREETPENVTITCSK